MIDDLSLEDRRAYWTNYDKWCAMFSQQEVDEQLLKLPVRSFVDELASPLRDWEGRHLNGGCWQQPQRLLRSSHEYYIFRNGGWERHERVLCNVYMVPAKYQHLQHAEVISAIMLARYPWLAQFKCNYYSMHFYDNHVNEFYVGCLHKHACHGVLYVPYDAFMQRDVEAIVKRNETYLKWYTHADDAWASMKNDETVLKFFELLRQS